jgi:hypothetical protein
LESAMPHLTYVRGRRQALGRNSEGNGPQCAVSSFPANADALLEVRGKRERVSGRRHR